MFESARPHLSVTTRIKVLLKVNLHANQMLICCVYTHFRSDQGI